MIVDEIQVRLIHNNKNTHHSDDFEVFQVRPLCGQNLFGNEVGFVSGIPLEENQDVSSKN